MAMLVNHRRDIPVVSLQEAKEAQGKPREDLIEKAVQNARESKTAHFVDTGKHGKRALSDETKSGLQDKAQNKLSDKAQNKLSDKVEKHLQDIDLPKNARSEKASYKMSVSSMTRKGDEKAIYVLFTDEIGCTDEKDGSDGKKCTDEKGRAGEKRYAEFRIPGAELLSAKGFSAEDVEQMKSYVENETDTIVAMAKEVDPIRGFLGR